MWTDTEREDYIFHKLIRLAGKYGEEISADRFDEMANCRMRLASHWQNKKRHCDVSCIILSDQTKMRRYVQ